MTMFASAFAWFRNITLEEAKHEQTAGQFSKIMWTKSVHMSEFCMTIYSIRYVYCVHILFLIRYL